MALSAEIIATTMRGIDLRRAPEDDLSAAVSTSMAIIQGRVMPAYTKLLISAPESHFELLSAWLGCHFWHMANKPQISSEAIGDANESYNYNLDLYFSNTLYGQTAMMLDESGTLKAIENRLKQTEEFITPRVMNLSPHTRCCGSHRPRLTARDLLEQEVEGAIEAGLEWDG